MKVIVFSPHPDDVEIAMGGTIAKYVQKGHNVRIVLVSIPNQREVREKEARRAAEILGAGLYFAGLDARGLFVNRGLVERFDGVIKDFMPDVIYTSWLHDSHQEHVVVSQATIAVARKNRCSLYMYEQQIPSGITPYAFRAQAFVDISDVMETKIKAVLAHESQATKYGKGWLEGIKGEASYWGFRIGVQYAEAFEVVKEIKVI